jgi:hypothetical protein
MVQNLASKPYKVRSYFFINEPQQNVHIPILMKDTCSLHVNKDCNVSLFHQNYSLHLLFGGNAGAEERQLVGRETPITLLYYYDRNGRNITSTSISSQCPYKKEEYPSYR